MVDEIGDIYSTLRARHGDKVKLRPVNARKGGLRRLVGMAAPAGLGSVGADFLGSVEERALWARLGL
jgi:hypothetical protein